MDDDTPRQIKALKNELEIARREAQSARDEAEKLRKELQEERKNERRSIRSGYRIDTDSSSEPEERRKGSKGKKKKVVTLKKNEEEKAAEVLAMEEDAVMEVEMAASPSVEEKKVILPSREEWPLVKRPSVLGKVKIIDDRNLEGTKVVISKERKNPLEKTTIAGGTTEALVQSIMKEMAPMMDKWLKSSLKNLGLAPAKSDLSKDATGKSDKATMSQPRTESKGRQEQHLEKKPLQAQNNISQVGSKVKSEQWSKVLGRKEKKKENLSGEGKGKTQPGKQVATTAQRQSSKPMSQSAKVATATEKKMSKRRPPRTAAITLTCPSGQYAEVMAAAKSQINLEELNIQEIRPKRAMMGALILEIPGPDGAKKASSLKDRMEAVLKDMEGVRVNLPIKKADLRIKDILDTVEVSELRDAVAQKGECNPEEVKVGVIRRAPNGLGTAWVQCPIPTANKLAAKGKIQVGWVTSRVELLPTKQLQCFRCLERGHVQANCRSEVDRRNACYRCGQTGHRAVECVEKPKCVICQEAGRPATHRMPREGRMGREVERWKFGYCSLFQLGSRTPPAGGAR